MSPCRTHAARRHVRSNRRLELALAAVLALALLASACSDDETEAAPATNAGGTTSTAPRTSTTTLPDRPDWPSADLSEEITGGSGVFIAATSGTDLEAAGYVEREYVSSGTATAYSATGPLSGDGLWSFEPAGTAEYRTRVLVRRPESPDDFSGTVVVEWLNVSSGLDANPDWGSLAEELMRRGHAWVGVSAQRIGVEGGPVLVSAPGAEGIAGKGLKGLDPERYGSLVHPGDGYSFDIYTQVATAIREGGSVMGGSEPQSVLAAGESQSAIALTTYYNGVQPLTHAFDGFFVHSRGSVGLPLVGPGEGADLAGSIGLEPTTLRTDLDAPVMDIQAEGDVTGLLASVEARQPDGDTFRLWEVAGTAHADASMLGPIADALDCGVAINNGPMHVVAKAALHSLDEWVRTGEAPPGAPRLDVTDGVSPAIARDADGIATGGIRTPPVDVPVDALSGEPGPSGGVMCMLMGSTVPLGAERLAELYSSRDDYDQRYKAAADDAIAAGFVLEEDRDALLGYADASRITG